MKQHNNRMDNYYFWYIDTLLLNEGFIPFHTAQGILAFLEVLQDNKQHFQVRLTYCTDLLTDQTNLKQIAAVLNIIDFNATFNKHRCKIQINSSLAQATMDLDPSEQQELAKFNDVKALSIADKQWLVGKIITTHDLQLPPDEQLFANSAPLNLELQACTKDFAHVYLPSSAHPKLLAIPQFKYDLDDLFNNGYIQLTITDLIVMCLKRLNPLNDQTDYNTAYFEQVSTAFLNQFINDHQLSAVHFNYFASLPYTPVNQNHLMQAECKYFQGQAGNKQYELQSAIASYIEPKPQLHQNVYLTSTYCTLNFNLKQNNEIIYDDKINLYLALKPHSKHLVRCELNPHAIDQEKVFLILSDKLKTANWLQGLMCAVKACLNNWNKAGDSKWLKTFNANSKSLLN